MEFKLDAKGEGMFTSSRIKRVDKILTSHPDTKDLLGNNFSEIPHEVVKTNSVGAKTTETITLKVSDMVIKVARSLADKQIDACTGSKNEILKEAAAVMGVSIKVEVNETATPPDSHILRVARILGNSPFAVHLKGDTTKYSDKKGEVNVTSDAIAIAATLFRDGKNAMGVPKEVVYVYARAYLKTTPEEEAAEVKKEAPKKETVADSETKEEAKVDVKHQALQRIDKVITSDPALQRLLKGNSVTLPKRSGAATYRVESVEIYKLIEEAGADPKNVTVDEILRCACAYFRVGDTPSKKKPSADLDYSMPVFVLLVSALQIAEHDNSAGSERRRAALDALAQEYKRVFQPE